MISIFVGLFLVVINLILWPTFLYLR